MNFKMCEKFDMYYEIYLNDLEYDKITSIKYFSNKLENMACKSATVDIIDELGDDYGFWVNIKTSNMEDSYALMVMVKQQLEEWVKE